MLPRINYNFSLGYNNTEDLAAYAMANLGDASSVSKKAMQVMDFYINTMYKPGSGYMLNAKFDDWGALRYPCNQAFSHALYSKLKGEKEIDPYTLTTIEFIMGKNPSNLSFIVGFGSKHPVIPHQGEPLTFVGVDKDKSGFMGVADWNVTAGSGCARAVVKAKKGNSAASELVVNNIVAGLYPNPVNDLLTIELFDNQEADVEVLNVFGSVVAKTRISATEKSLNLSALSKGIYVVRVSNGESVYTERIVKK